MNLKRQNKMGAEVIYKWAGLLPFSASGVKGSKENRSDLEA